MPSVSSERNMSMRSLFVLHLTLYTYQNMVHKVTYNSPPPVVCWYIARTISCLPALCLSEYPLNQRAQPHVQLQHDRVRP